MFSILPPWPPNDTAPRPQGLSWVVGAQYQRELFQKLLPSAYHTTLPPQFITRLGPRCRLKLLRLYLLGSFCPGLDPVVSFPWYPHPSRVPVPWR